MLEVPDHEAHDSVGFDILSPQFPMLISTSNSRQSSLTSMLWFRICLVAKERITARRLAKQPTITTKSNEAALSLKAEHRQIPQNQVCNLFPHRSFSSALGEITSPTSSIFCVSFWNSVRPSIFVGYARLYPSCLISISSSKSWDRPRRDR